jgi:y4mF family transcriptional regulator
MRFAMLPVDIGALVRDVRKRQGLLQAELAAAAGVGLRFLIELEAGKPTVQLGKVLDVLAALGCSVRILTPEER